METLKKIWKPIDKVISHRLTACISLAWLLLMGIALPNGDDSTPAPWDEDEPETILAPDDDPVFPEKSFFHIEHRGDVHEPNRWLIVLEVPPPTLPGAVGARVNQMVMLRGVDVPTSRVWSNDHAPPRDKDRQRSKNALAESFVWDICKPPNMRFSWIENPVPSEEHQCLVVDVKYSRGDSIINMADAMIELGYAVRMSLEPHDWGKP